MVKARVGRTFIDVSLAVWSSEASTAGANVSTDHVFAGASIHTWVGFTFIIVNVTVFTNPARVTQTFISIDFVFTVTMATGVTEALVDLGEASAVTVSFRTHTGEAVDAINAGPAIVAGVDSTLINVNVTHGTRITRLTCTLIAIDFVNACSRITGIALAVINVDFTIDSSGAFGTVANV